MSGADPPDLKGPSAKPPSQTLNTGIIGNQTFHIRKFSQTKAPRGMDPFSVPLQQYQAPNASQLAPASDPEAQLARSLGTQHGLSAATAQLEARPALPGDDLRASFIAPSFSPPPGRPGDDLRCHLITPP